MNCILLLAYFGSHTDWKNVDGKSDIQYILFTSTSNINQLVFVIVSYCVIREIGTEILRIIYLEYIIRGTSAKRKKLAFLDLLLQDFLYFKIEI